MDTVTEIRLLFIVGLVVLAVAISILGLVAQWLIGRVARGRGWLAASRSCEARAADHKPRRLDQELGARAARWRMLL